jgi:beta-lactamase regulating signal transducer with metallopeptidase domain
MIVGNQLFGLAHFWLECFLDATIAGTLLLGFLLLVLAVLRRASASLRSLLLSLGLIGLFSLPLVSLVLPRARVPVLPQELTTSLSPVFEHPVSSTVEQPSGSAEATGDHTTVMTGQEVVPDAVPSASVPRTQRVPWSFWAFCVWSLGVLVTALPLIFGVAAVRRVRHKGVPISDREELAKRISALASQFSLRRRVRLVMIKGTVVPMAYGFLRPTMFLPIQWQEWSEERKRAVLLHEIAHMLRFDCLVQWVAELATALFWFHPLAWLAARRLRLEREQACDDFALQAGCEPAGYATHLLEIARNVVAAGTTAAAVPMARRSTLERRLVSVLDKHRRREPVKRRVAGVAMAGTAGLVLSLASIQCTSTRASAIVSDEVGAATRVTVTVRFLDLGGKPTQGVRLTAPYLLGAPSAVSASDGRVTLDLPWPLPRAKPPRSFTRHPPLENQLALRAAGVDRSAWFAWKRVDRPGKYDLADIHQAAGGTVEGRVLDANGKPVTGAWVDVRSPIQHVPEARVYDWIPIGSDVLNPCPIPVFTNSEGRYRLDGVPDTFVSVVAKGVDSLYSFTEPLAVQRGRVVTASDIVLQTAPRDHVISGIVLGRDGKPCADVLVNVGDDRTVVLTSFTWTRSDGQFELLVLPGQSYQVLVASPKTRVVANPGDRDVVIRIDAETLAEIEKQSTEYDPDADDPDEETAIKATASRPPACVVRGRILLGGKPPVGWTCRAINDNHPDLDWRPVSADGRFEIQLPDAGQYSLAIIFREPISASVQGFDIPIELKPGVNEWSRVIPVGTLVLENLEPLPTLQELSEQEGDVEKGYSLYWKGQGFEWTAARYAGPGKVWKLPDAPAGEIRFTSLTPENRYEMPGDRPAQMRIMLAPGETKHVRIK